ncbi:hypothetical protein OG883_27955 [Streptomyces sp. NBC_01142]|uniref:hypothetical protein n=1 Tax=Streptomyces sp. NBC_01142 TaxID=2975865 RepID=UPI0022563576|nr:hypothetical protein [Streptomyces sp. NBC_01142]MCX4823641.1 hypothetical protein [Streptomyces sp. NBC_01142]
MSARALPRRRPAALAALCTAAALTLTLTLTACGQDPEPTPTGPFAGLSGPEIVNRAVKATKTARSVTLDIDTRTDEGPMKAFMATNTKGQCAGTLSIGATGTAELIKTDGTAYMRFDEAFLREESKGEPAAEAAAVLKMLKGRWLETGVTEADARESLELCDLSSLLADFETNDTEARRGGETTVNGKKALMLTESEGDEKYTVYVATEGKPYLLKIEQKGGEEPGTMTFAEYNKPVPAKKPAAKDIVDLDADS